MAYSTTYEHTPAVGREGFLLHTRHKPRNLLYGLGYAAIGLFFLPDRSHHLFAGMLLGSSVTILLRYLSAYRTAGGESVGIGTHPVAIRFDERGFATEGAQGTGIISWEMIDDFWVSRRVCVLGYRGGYSFHPIPAQALDGETREFIERSIADAKRRRAEKGA